MTTDDPARLLTAQDVMEILGCSRSFVSEHGTSMGATKLGNLWRVRRADLDAWIARGRKAPPAEEPAPTPLRPAAQLGRGPINPVSKQAWSRR